MTIDELRAKHDWEAFNEALLDLIRFEEQEENSEATPLSEALDTVRLMVLDFE